MCGAGRLKAVGTLNFMIENKEHRDVEVVLNLSSASEFQDYENLKPVAEIPVVIPAGFKGELPVKVDREMDDEFLVMAFEGNVRNVNWAVSRQSLPQICSYSVWNGHEHYQTKHVPAFYATPPLENHVDFGAACVNNGKTRVWQFDGSVNMWMSDPAQSMPQWVQLAWEKPQAVSEVRVVFDTNLNRTWFEQLAVPERVKDYEIQAWVEGTWKTVAEETGNIQRLRIHKIEPVQADKIRVVVKKTWGDKAARIFEVRAY
jgi:hypothetical protein